MGISPAVGIEPVPGYHLVELLGKGGFGEVGLGETEAEVVERAMSKEGTER